MLYRKPSRKGCYCFCLYCTTVHIRVLFFSIYIRTIHYNTLKSHYCQISTSKTHLSAQNRWQAFPVCHFSHGFTCCEVEQGIHVHFYSVHLKILAMISLKLLLACKNATLGSWRFSSMLILKRTFFLFHLPVCFLESNPSTFK